VVRTLRPFRLIVPAVLIAVAMPLHAEIYRWTDSNGVTHFSDKPHSGAKKLGHVEAPVVQSEPPAMPASGADDSGNKTVQASYQSIAFEQPAPQATIRNNPGQVNVTLAIKPGLKPGDRIALEMDGKPVSGSPFRDTGVTLHGINRGSHTLRAHIIDAQGNTLIKADPVTFYMHRPSVNLPARQK